MQVLAALSNSSTAILLQYDCFPSEGIMKRVILLFILCSLALVFVNALPAAGPPQPGGQLPEFKFPLPTDRADRGYLGLSGWGSTFRIPDIKARVVIVEILSMYCPFCQKEAPLVNDLYGAIEKDATLKGKIKIVGVGAGNSAYEVEVFRKKYGIPFPVIPDPDYAAYNLYGEVRTPYFIAVKINDNGTHEVIYSKLGSFGDVRAFLDTIKKSAGL
jgi:thiol-disulfide isomerase/thioredoxin